MAVARTKGGQDGGKAAPGRADAHNGDVAGSDGQQALLGALTAAADGDFSKRLRTDSKDGPSREVASAYNRLADLTSRMENELVRNRTGRGT